MKTNLEMVKNLKTLSSTQFQTLFNELKNQSEKDCALLHRCATDLELFALTFFSHYCKYSFNEFHYDTFESYDFGARKVRRARGAPRGYAKSTIQALIKPIHDLCYELETYICIFSNTDSQATGKLKDIRNELLNNHYLIDFYRIKFPSIRVAEGSFLAYSGSHSIKFEAYGTGAQIRGVRHGAHRPSKLVFDDVEHSEEVENEALRDKYAQWYQSDVVKSGDENTNIEFVGTVLHRDSLLKNLTQNPLYDSKIYKAVKSWSTRPELWEQFRKLLYNFEVGKEERLGNAMSFYKSNEAAMLEGTSVLWPEREPYVELMKEFYEIGKLAFFKEKQNDPLGSTDRIFTKFTWCVDYEKDGEKGILIEDTQVFIPLRHCRAYATVDPATGQTKASSRKKLDFSCILTGYQEPKGRLIVYRDWTERCPPTKYIKKILELNDIYHYEKVGVETNLYRNLLLPNIEAARKELEKERDGKLVKLPLYDIENVENKEKRIYTLEPKITNGYIILNRSLSQEFKNQLEDFPKADHDDCPDALEMLYGMINGRYKMSSVALNPTGGR